MAQNGPIKFSFGLPAVLASGTQITASFTQSAASPVCIIHRIGFLFLGTGYAP
jgi:hypothetical protein